MGIRYQHAYNTLNVPGRGTVKVIAKPQPNSPTDRRPLEKPALTTEILISGGFTRIGQWVLTGERLTLENRAPKARGVYAFAKAGAAVYVGVATKGLASRLYSYGRPGISQRTNQRLKAIIVAELLGAQAIEIYVALPPDLEWNGLPVNGSAGLELGLIERFALPWNMRGGTGLER